MIKKETFMLLLLLVMASLAFGCGLRDPTATEFEKYEKAISNLDHELCLTISQKAVSDYSRNSFSSKTNKFNLQISCLEQVASATGNPDVCNLISNKYYDQNSIETIIKLCIRDANETW